jgi:hypothetical protein
MPIGTEALQNIQTKLTMNTPGDGYEQEADRIAAGLLAMGMRPGRVVVGGVVATGQPEMMALCQGLYHQGPGSSPAKERSPGETIA